jgi:hypothetical protein
MSSKKSYGSRFVYALLALCLPLAGAAQEPAVETPVPAQPQAEQPAPRAKTLGLPIDLSGYVWVDSGMLMRDNANTATPDQNSAYMAGRFVVAGTYLRDFGDVFAEAKLELVGLTNEWTNSNDDRPILDAYLKVGQGRWNVQVGRFLGEEVYFRGQGIELYTPEEAGATAAPKPYLLDFARGHLNGPGQVAVHLAPSRFLKIELGGVYGQENNQTYVGARPVVAVNAGNLKLIAGYEYLDQSPQIASNKVEATSQGYAASVQYGLPYVNVGLNFAQASVETTQIDGLVNAEKTFDATTFGGFVDLDFWKNSIGLGYHRTLTKNNQGEEPYQDQAFVSYLYRLPVEGLSVKAVYGLAKGHIEDVDVAGGASWENTLQSFRLRVAYEFK